MHTKEPKAESDLLDFPSCFFSLDKMCKRLSCSRWIMFCLYWLKSSSTWIISSLAQILCLSCTSLVSHCCERLNVKSVCPLRHVLVLIQAVILFLQSTPQTARRSIQSFTDHHQLLLFGFVFRNFSTASLLLSSSSHHTHRDVSAASHKSNQSVTRSVLSFFLTSTKPAGQAQRAGAVRIQEDLGLRPGSFRRLSLFLKPPLLWSRETHTVVLGQQMTRRRSEEHSSPL